MKLIYSILLIYIGFSLSSCQNQPKVIVEDATSASDTSHNHSHITNQTMNSPANPAIDNSVHKVLVNEVMQTDRYTYLNVTERGRKFWIATAKLEATRGKFYIYQGGLMKTNFESQEFNRVFDTLYLVSSVIDESMHPGGNIDASGNTHNHPVDNVTETVSANSTPIKDALKISQLFSDKKKYEGQVVTVQGKVTKVNNGIMGRNWVHIQDGSKHEGKTLDLTLTTLDQVALGAQVGFSGKVVLEKDFGAGYKYQILLEESKQIR